MVEVDGELVVTVETADDRKGRHARGVAAPVHDRPTVVMRDVATFDSGHPQVAARSGIDPHPSPRARGSGGGSGA